MLGCEVGAVTWARPELRLRPPGRPPAAVSSHDSRWCPRSESNRHAFKGGGFSCHFSFRCPGEYFRVRGLEHAFTVAF
jgi:hypothetical protein